MKLACLSENPFTYKGKGCSGLLIDAGEVYLFRLRGGTPCRYNGKASCTSKQTVTRLY